MMAEFLRVNTEGKEMPKRLWLVYLSAFVCGFLVSNFVRNGLELLARVRQTKSGSHDRFLATTQQVLPLSQYQSRFNIVLRGQFTTRSAMLLDYSLSVLPRCVRASIRSISLNDDVRHYGLLDGGHCHETRNICIKTDSLETTHLDFCDRVVWHEAAHAYESYLDSRGSDFTKQWRVVAGEDVYGCDSPVFPNHGILCEYGSKNYTEDIATFVEYLYCSTTFVHGTTHNHNYFAYLPVVRRVNQGQLDARFRRKLDLLLKYGFVSKEDHDRFLKLGYLD